MHRDDGMGGNMQNRRGHRNGNNNNQRIGNSHKIQGNHKMNVAENIDPTLLQGTNPYNA